MLTSERVLLFHRRLSAFRMNHRTRDIEGRFFFQRTFWVSGTIRLPGVRREILSIAVLTAGIIGFVVFHSSTFHQSHFLLFRLIYLFETLFFNVDGYRLFFGFLLFTDWSWTIGLFRQRRLRGRRFDTLLGLSIVVEVHLCLRFWFGSVFIIRKRNYFKFFLLFELLDNISLLTFLLTWLVVWLFSPWTLITDIGFVVILVSSHRRLFLSFYVFARFVAFLAFIVRIISWKRRRHTV